MKRFLAIALLFSLSLEAKKMSFGEAKSQLTSLQSQVSQIEAEIASAHRKIDNMHTQSKDFAKAESHTEQINHHNTTLRSLIERTNKELPGKLHEARKRLNDFLQEAGRYFKVLHNTNGTYELSSEVSVKPQPVTIGHPQVTATK